MSTVRIPSQSQFQGSPELDNDNSKYATHCTCGEKLQMKISWTYKNHGRRFVIWPKDSIRECSSFKWVDPSFPSQAKKVIKDLLDARSELYSYNSQINAERVDLKTPMDKLKVEFHGKVAMLEGELMAARSQNIQGKWKGVSIVLVVVLVATWVKLLV